MKKNTNPKTRSPVLAISFGVEHARSRPCRATFSARRAGAWRLLHVGLMYRAGWLPSGDSVGCAEQNPTAVPRLPTAEQTPSAAIRAGEKLGDNRPLSPRSCTAGVLCPARCRSAAKANSAAPVRPEVLPFDTPSTGGARALNARRQRCHADRQAPQHAATVTRAAPTTTANPPIGWYGIAQPKRQDGARSAGENRAREDIGWHRIAARRVVDV